MVLCLGEIAALVAIAIGGTGLACVLSEIDSKIKCKTDEKQRDIINVNVVRMGDIWSVETDKSIYFEVTADCEEVAREKVELRLNDLGYDKMNVRLYL